MKAARSFDLSQATLDYLWPIEPSMEDEVDMASLESLKAMDWEEIDEAWVEHLR